MPVKVSLQSPVSSLPRVGTKTTAVLKKLEIFTCQDLLMWYPFRYEDFRTITPIGSLKEFSFACVKGKIRLLQHRRSFRRHVSLTEALIDDGSGSIKCIWFNQPYLTKIFKEGDDIVLAGKVDVGKYGIQFINPVTEKMSASPVHTARIVPWYPSTKDLAQKFLRSMITSVLPLAKHIPDPVPLAVRKKFRLMPLGEAIKIIHFPVTLKHAEQARERIALQEVSDLYVRLSLLRKKIRKENSFSLTGLADEIQHMADSLPFELTGSQTKALEDIGKDMSESFPMNRMLDGDVGSGKTIIAHLIASLCARHSLQTALLAPTDILATQHFESYQMFFKTQYPIALFTRTKQLLCIDGEVTAIKKKDLIKKIAANEVAYCIGTHAMIQPTVRFGSLGLVIVDEQHRFGVEQRATLIASFKKSTKKTPHYLSLTATPIPRSLARIYFGGAEVSLLAEKPKGRLPITTTILAEAERERAYQHIRNEVAKGHQAYIICPLIDESDALGVKAATAEYERLAKDPLQGLAIGLVHGKIKTKERDAIMSDFYENKISVLVATAVVEVGVDAPGATVMLIEGAERFGLAQLHQFRGRIGRSDMPSTCYAIYNESSDRAKKRLHAFQSTNDGFKLASLDLSLRGQGDIFGTIQSGLVPFKIADMANIALLEKGRELAKNLIETLQN